MYCFYVDLSTASKIPVKDSLTGIFLIIILLFLLP